VSGQWNASIEFGEFLRARRAGLSPEACGIRDDSPRRVSGLRREELAQLAGISVNYYTRLEQGEGHQASDSVLEAIAHALDLTPDERVHLFRLARPAQVVRRGTDTDTDERARPPVRALVEAVVGQAAIVVGHRADILGGNRLGYALLGLQPPGPDDVRPDPMPNMAWMTFLDPTMRNLFVDWERQARDMASYLRFAASEQPDDQRLNELIGVLTVKSPDFSRIWSAHPVSGCTKSVREYHHPLVGPLTLNEEILRVSEDPGQRVIFSGAPSQSGSAERLQLLDSLVS
jgi:transcriptional regulator with XRE-family HTH domain